MTFPESAERYLQQHLNARASYRFYCRLHRQYFSSWQAHPTKSQIRDWHRAHAATPANANKGLGYLKALYGWLINEGLWSTESPAAGIRRHQTFSRDVCLTQQELALLMNSLDCVFWKFKVLMVFLLTTACRLSEALNTKWEHVDLDTGVWFKPHTKNGKPQRIPLAIQTCALLAALPDRDGYILKGLYGRPLSRTAAEKMWGMVRRPLFLEGERTPALRMPHIRLHDLRRTVATRLLEQGENMLVLKSILHHIVDSGDVTGIYARPSLDMQRRALQQQADSLWALLKEVSHDTSPQLPFGPHNFERMCAAEPGEYAGRERRHRGTTHPHVPTDPLCQ